MLDTNICFSFPPYMLRGSDKISFVDFETSYHGSTFDEVLLYVKFGRVELDIPNIRPRHTEVNLDPGAGRKDMETFFNWLYSKGVRNIVKVIVEDRYGIVHCDQSIETALKRFEIEILSWRKYDLCPKAIREACKKPSLREIHLWWSGNNAVLRSWSEPDGLAKLPKLERVHLHEPQVWNRLSTAQGYEAHL